VPSSKKDWGEAKKRFLDFPERYNLGEEDSKKMEVTEQPKTPAAGSGKKETEERE